MKRAWMGLSLFALIPLAAACSRPAQAPSGGGTTAPGETGTPSGQQAPTSQIGPQEQGAMGQQPGMEFGALGQQGQQGQQAGQMQPGEQGQQVQPGQQGQQGLGSGIGQGQQAGQQTGQPSEGGQQGAAAGLNERQLCETLAQGARMRVEDVQGGVAIVMTPKGGTNLSTIRDDARKLENSIRMGTGGEGVVGAPQRGVRSGETCGIAELGRLPSVTTQLTEAANSVRIMMTTSNNNEVRDLRRIARDEINALTKSQGGQQPTRPKPQPKGGQQPEKGGQQQQP